LEAQLTNSDAINPALTPADIEGRQNVEAYAMVSVQLRNSGQGLWTALSLPTSVQMAQTLAAAARKLNLADQVRIEPSAAPLPAGQHVNVSV